MVDEYSRFPFAFPCSDMSSQTVISCLHKLFSIFGCPSSVHSDRAAQFMSQDVSEYLRNHGIVMTHSTPYHPTGNAQCERTVGNLWRTVRLALKSLKYPECKWELVLDSALHSIRSLLCTATNQTPHERLFSFPRRSFNGHSLPSWLTSPGPVLLRKFVRTSKSDPLVEEVDLESATPHYAHIRYPDGRQSTVSTKDLAPTPRDPNPVHVPCSRRPPELPVHVPVTPTSDESTTNQDSGRTIPNTNYPTPDNKESTGIKDGCTAETLLPPTPTRVEPLRRSTRVRKPPDRLGY